MATWTVSRLELGSFAAPADHPAAGQRIVVCGFLLRSDGHSILVDTGFADALPPNDERELAVRRLSLDHALAEHGVSIDDIEAVANCHLHADHAGGNHRFAVPIHVQAAEVAAAREPDFTVAEAVALDRANYLVHEGEAEIADGVRIIPTPGHTPGHQAVAVDTAEGLVVLAGQAYRWASEFSMAAYAHRLACRGEEAPERPDWLPSILELRPSRVLFGHDFAVWRPDA